MKNASDTICIESQNTQFMSYYVFPKIVEKYGRTRQANDIIRRLRIACWVPKAAITLSEYVILLQQWLHEHASALRFTRIGCLVQTDSRVPQSLDVINIVILCLERRGQVTT
jgi:hypothetical protein